MVWLHIGREVNNHNSVHIWQFRFCFLFTILQNGKNGRNEKTNNNLHAQKVVDAHCTLHNARIRIRLRNQFQSWTPKKSFKIMYKISPNAFSPYAHLFRIMGSIVNCNFQTESAWHWHIHTWCLLCARCTRSPWIMNFEK